MGDIFVKRDASEHLSVLAFDRLLAGEPRGLARVRVHLERCPPCRERLAELRRARQLTLVDPAAPARVAAIRRAAACSCGQTPCRCGSDGSCG